MKALVHWKASNKQKAAMSEEINRQIADKMRNHEDNMDALVLYVLFDKYGWRKKRLRKFYENFIKDYDELIEYYEMPGEEKWIARKKLEDAGINVDQWNNEVHGKNREDSNYVDSD